MKKFLTLFLMTSFFTVAAPAFDNSEVYYIGAEEFTAPVLDESVVDELMQEDMDPYRSYRCPHGYRRVPSYRWNPRRNRWEQRGYTCRREHRGGGGGGDHRGGDRGRGHR